MENNRKQSKTKRKKERNQKLHRDSKTKEMGIKRKGARK